MEGYTQVFGQSTNDYHQAFAKANAKSAELRELVRVKDEALMKIMTIIARKNPTNQWEAGYSAATVVAQHYASVALALKEKNDG